MNSKVIIAIACAVLVIGGGVAFIAMSGDDENSETKSSQTSSSGSANESSEKEVNGNLKSISSGGKPQSCTFSYSGENGSGTGKMFTDGKGRGLLTMDLTTEQGNVGQSNTLTTTDKVYSWTKTDSQSVGFVFDASTLESNTSTPGTSSSQTQNASKDFSLKCKSWTVDETVLAVPSDVTFSTLPTTP